MRLIGVMAAVLALAAAARAGVVVGVNDDAGKNAGQAGWFYPALGAEGLQDDAITLRWDESAPLTVPDQEADETAVVLVGRGSSDPDANADLHKVARLLWDSRGLAMVEPAFVSLARPSVAEALDRVQRLGARRVVVLPYFLFTGLLVERIAAQETAWTTGNDGVDVRNGPYLGADPRIARLVLERHAEAIDGAARMNCDCCIYRTALPGYEHRVGEPVHDHAHGGR